MRALVTVLTLGLSACGDPSPPTALRPAVGEAPEVSAAPAPPASAPPICAEVGSLASVEIPDAARETNEALVHRLSSDGADVVAIEIELAALIASTPGYRMARYNHACALARLGRLDEAWDELLPLLCEELPTFAPRVSGDPDLQGIRARGDLDATLSAVAALYRDAARGGAPLVTWTTGPVRVDDGVEQGIEWQETQAGSYQLATGRFVPMGPRLRERGVPGASGNGGYPLSATRWDPASGRVLSLVARGTDAEDPSFGPVEVRVHEAVTGTELSRHRFVVEGSFAASRLTEGGALAWYDDFDLDEVALSIDRSGAHPSRERRAAPFLAVRTVAWWYEAHPWIEARRETVTLGERVLTLGPRPRGEERAVIETTDPDVSLVLTYHHATCERNSHFLLERFDRDGARRTLLEEDVHPTIEVIDGVIFVQARDLRAFPDLGMGTPIVVRPGVGLRSMGSPGPHPLC